MPEADRREFRGALGRFASGVTVLTVRVEEETHGMTANAFVSVSLDPALVLVSLDNRSRLRKVLPEIPRFGISVLAEDQEQISDHFAKRSAHDVRVGYIERHGVPLIEGAVAHFVAEAIDIHPAGDHTLFIARVEYFTSREGRPLIFYASAYQRLRAEKPKTGEFSQDDFSLFSIGGFGDGGWPDS